MTFNVNFLPDKNIYIHQLNKNQEISELVVKGTSLIYIFGDEYEDIRVQLIDGVTYFSEKSAFSRPVMKSHYKLKLTDKSFYVFSESIFNINYISEQLTNDNTDYCIVLGRDIADIAPEDEFRAYDRNILRYMDGISSFLFSYIQ
ncbi:hypothetical protein ABK040_005721 [Willaertia magna]